jgi:hypothetical protein
VGRPEGTEAAPPGRSEHPPPGVARTCDSVSPHPASCSPGAGPPRVARGLRPASAGG